MLTHEEQLRINDLIISIEDYYFSTADYENYDPSAEKAEKPWQAWCEIWKYMERENNYSGSLGVQNDWMMINIVGDLEELLYNSGMYQELLQLCEQELKINWEDDGDGESYSTRQNMHESAKMMMSDAYYAMGEKEKALEILRQQLNDDPLWGLGWMAYWRMLNDCSNPEYEEVIEKIYEGLKDGTPYRDKEFVADALADVFSYLQEKEKADFCRTMGIYGKQQTVIKGPKIGRNDPCPCGSGKKYKKCCGR